MTEVVLRTWIMKGYFENQTNTNNDLDSVLCLNMNSNYNSGVIK